MKNYRTIGLQEVKATLIYLKLIKTLLRRRQYNPEEAIKHAVALEEELYSLVRRNEILAECCNTLASFSFEYEYSPLYCGAEIIGSDHFANPDYRPISDLLCNKEFNVERIDEIICLFEKLVNLNIGNVTIDIKRSAEKWGLEKLSSPTPNIIAQTPEGFYRDHYYIYKLYSDVDIKYSKLKTKRDRWKNNECFQEYHTCDFVGTPNWIISGLVVYKRTGEIYLGASSPHTQFNFRSSTLYPNLINVPERDDLYSPRETDSLSMFKKMTRN